MPSLANASSQPATNNPHDHNLAYPELPLRKGMEIIVNGTEEAIDKAIAVLGEEIHVNLHEEDGLVYRRVTVSSPEVAGRTIDELNTEYKGFIIARVRKGDSDVVPAPEMVLNYSDRVRVITAPGRLDDVRRYLGAIGRSGPINWQLPSTRSRLCPHWDSRSS